MDRPLVSIITPVYNCQEFLSHAIKSVVNQTYSNWELLLLDDCSTDHSCEIAEKYVKESSRIRLIKNLKNLGVSATRNHGIEIANGDWIAFLDSDDVWEEDKLQLQLELAEKKGGEFIYGNYSHISESGQFLKQIECAESTNYRNMLKGSQIGCLTVLINAKILKKHRFVNDFHEDYILWLEILSNNLEAYGVQKTIAKYRLRPDSRSANKFECLKSQWKIYRKYRNLGLIKSSILLFQYSKKGILKHWI